MFAGFSICSHVVAVAECNGDLKSFLDAASATCAPNLSAIANQGLPREGGIPKRKRKTAVPIQLRSVRPCLVGIAGTSSTSQVAESSNLEPPQSSNITPALDAQDSFSQHVTALST